MAGIAEGRLREERRSWRKDHPIGFVARPRSKADGSTDLLNWDVVIPGKKDTMYAFPRPRCLLILVSGRVSTSCRHDGVPARRTRDVLPTVTPSPRRTLMTTPRACRWEGCEFNLTMEFSSDYPATAPVVKFVSRPGEVESCVEINVEQTQLRRRYRVDGVGRPKFDFHTGLLAPERLE